MYYQDKEKRDHLRGLVRTCLKEADGNPDDAMQKFMSIVNEDEDFFKRYAIHIIYDWAHIWTHRMFRTVRSKFWNRGLPKEKTGRGQETEPRTFVGEMLNLQRNYMDMWLNKSKVYLCEATKEQLTVEADMHRNYAERNEEKARFYNRLSRKLEQDQTVADVYTEQQLEEISQQIKDAIRGKWAKEHEAVPEVQQEAEAVA